MKYLLLTKLGYEVAQSNATFIMDSFPLDEGKCKVAYVKYMVCLSENAHKNSKCREHPGPRASVLGDITRVYWHPESRALSGPAAPLQSCHGQWSAPGRR